jgi:hypothetical protein
MNTIEYCDSQKPAAADALENGDTAVHIVNNKKSGDNDINKYNNKRLSEGGFCQPIDHHTPYDPQYQQCK